MNEVALRPSKSSWAISGTGSTALVFTGTIFVSAFLLFLIQPLFGKMALPLLGGAPGVWNTALVFFQAALLAGYLYAHLTSRYLPMRAQIGLHAVVLVVATLALPVTISAAWQSPPDSMPIFWLLGLLAANVGLPFFALSANAPLLQRWFAASDHARAGDPYFLYAASNLGSVIALLAYPLIVEPSIGLTGQSMLWSAGFVGLAGLIGLSAWTVWRGAPTAAAQTAIHATSDITWRQRAIWTALAFIPSGLLLSVTGHITTDIVAVPLLWVVPLALYLLSFTFVFAARPLLTPRWFKPLLPACLVAAAFLVFLPQLTNAYLAAGLALLTLFAVSMVCHGRLAALRPSSDHLTEFYLWMSFGGVLGGAFVGLGAPMLFDGVWEYPILLVASAIAARVGVTQARRLRVPDILLPLSLAAAIVALEAGVDLSPDSVEIVMLVMVATGGLLVWGLRRPLPLGILIICVLLLGHAVGQHRGSVSLIAQERSFFGVHRVKLVEDPGIAQLVHGNIIHGAQFTDNERGGEPLLYYDWRAGLGQITAAMAAEGRLGLAVGAIGLGTGASACHAVPGQRWTFFEIDPVVERLAREHFSYLARCRPNAQVVIGDARLTLTRGTEGRFDLIAVDAFSSDAIPLHLITSEAVGLYRSRLEDGGLLVFHISNRYLDLEPVMARLARAHGLEARVFEYDPTFGGKAERAPWEVPSTWVVMGSDTTRLDRLFGPIDEGTGTWRAPRREPGMRLWTDNYSNILSVLK